MINPDDFPIDATFAVSDSGYMISELFFEWMKIFVQKIPPVRPVLLVIDGHASHITLQVIRFARQNDVEIFCLTPHTTHLFQPLDVGVFRSLKEKFRQEASRILRRKRGKVTRKKFGKVFRPAYYKSVTPYNVVNGFKATGLWPVNRSAVNLSEVNSKKRTQHDESISSANVSSVTPSSASISPARQTSTSLTSTTSTSTPSTSIPSTSHSTPPEGSIVAKVIRKFLEDSPQKVKLKVSRRITTSRVLTSAEYIEKLEEIEKKEIEKKEKLKQKKKSKPSTSLGKEPGMETVSKRKLVQKPSNVVNCAPKSSKKKKKSRESSLEEFGWTEDEWRKAEEAKQQDDAILLSSIAQDADEYTHEHLTEPGTYRAGDWVVVQFMSDDLKTYLKFIAQILRVNKPDDDKEEEVFRVDCLRPKRTKEHQGFIYRYPDVRDNKSCCLFSQILYKLNPPENWQRCLKFDVSCTDL
jgi:hypothetical protein